MPEFNDYKDGFNARLVETATFSGILEIPVIHRPDQIVVPVNLVPFSRRKSVHINPKDCFVCFYEHDRHFSTFLQEPEIFIDDLRPFAGGISPDCSLYRDSPLVIQMYNTYRNRAVGSFLQKQGLYVVPNIRWGDERSYTCECFYPESFAFLGAEKHSIVSIGTYGCIRGEDNTFHFKAGLEAMLNELKPEVVLVYGAMPDRIFAEFEGITRFIQYQDWTSFRKGGKYGNR